MCDYLDDHHIRVLPMDQHTFGVSEGVVKIIPPIVVSNCGERSNRAALEAGLGDLGDSRDKLEKLDKLDKLDKFENRDRRDRLDHRDQLDNRDNWNKDNWNREKGR
jgi:hypothetical protein